MKLRLERLLSTSALLLLLTAAGASAQGGATSIISGVIQDTEGGVIPGATVVVMSNATQTKFEAVTNSAGAFTVPALDAGTYTVSVSLAGFKNAVITDVRVQPGVPTTVNATLQVGDLVETITVTGASAALINTQTPSVVATMNVDEVAAIPTPTRNALNAVTYLVGINTTGSMRGSTVNGLPESFLNITLDGVSNNDTFNKSGDGFFSPVRPRQDAVEAVSVTSAVGGADTGGGGAVSINFTTRQGTNRFTGSGYEYFRDPSLNTNYWFNRKDGLGRDQVRLNQFGARQGGPIMLPGLYDGHGKAFFFVHYEETRLPNTVARARTVLHPRALDGWFRYNVTVGGVPQVREVNVLDLARASGQLATTDPTVMYILRSIQDRPRIAGVMNESSDPLLMNYSFLSPGYQTEKQPLIRIDYNLGANHRLNGMYSHFFEDRAQDHINGADGRFPGSPNYRHAFTRRPLRTVGLRSTLTSNVVNEFRFGITRGERLFFGDLASVGSQSFDDTNGFSIDLDANIGLTNWHTTNTLSSRSGYQYTFSENLNWTKGKHAVLIGGEVFLGRTWNDSQQMVPGIDLSFDNNNDPAIGLFAAGNFPGASGGQITDARDLYALLTGRVSAVTGLATLDAKTNKYSYLGTRRRAGKLDQYSMYVQDSWRLTPTLTLNAGVRWELQMPFSPVNDTMTAASLADVCGVSGLGDGGLYSSCRFYVPGASGGQVPEFNQIKRGTLGYNIDWNNIAPNVGVAWRPQVETGWLRALLGDPEQATLRGGYSVAYVRQGLGDFTGVFGPNPGSTLSLTRNANTGLVGPGETWPVLLRETNRLYPAPFSETPAFPIPIRPNRADNINAFHPDIQVPRARSWTVGLQRAVTQDMAVEIRYVATRGLDQWPDDPINYNERNRIENGFQDEFIRAMNNLTANNLAGGARTGSFAYFGPGTGTSPLPIYLAYLNARRDADNPAAYAGGTNTWANTAITQDLVRTNPQPGNSATDLDGNLNRRNNALVAGLAANFFVVNPHANNVNVTDSGEFSSYHALQIELRRRLSHGLSANASYQYAMEGISSFQGFHFGRVLDTRNSSVRHAIKTQWDWKIPVGRDERFGANMGAIMNGILGGWQFNGAGRIQKRTANFGNVRLVGMTAKDAQKMFKFYQGPDPRTGVLTVSTMPEDVILNTRRAFSTSTTSPTGYSDLGIPEGRYFAPANSEDCIQLKEGDCAPRRLTLISPFFTRFDIGITKRFPIQGRVNFEFRVDVLNVFDNINFDISQNARTAGSGATIFQVTAAYRDPNNTYDPGGRLGQIVFRLNW